MDPEIPGPFRVKHERNALTTTLLLLKLLELFACTLILPAFLKYIS